MRALIAAFVLGSFAVPAAAVPISPLSPLSPVSVLFSGTLESYNRISADGGRTDLTPFLTHREVSGRIDFELFDSVVVAINTPEGYRSILQGDFMSIGLSWSGGELNPSDYPRDQCGPCSGGDYYFLRRDLGSGQSFSAGDRMHLVDQELIVDYSEVVLQMVGELFGNPGSTMSLDDLYKLPGPVDGSGTFRQFYQQYVGGNDPHILLSGYEGTFRISNAIAAPVPVPEPGTLALFALGLAGIALTYRRRGVSGAGVNRII